MGYPNMDFLVREVRAVTEGPLRIVRLGSCAGLRPDVPVGSVTVASEGSIFISQNPDAWGSWAGDGETKEGAEIEQNGTITCPKEEPYVFHAVAPADEDLSRGLLKELKRNLEGGDEGVAVVGCLDASADSFYSSQGEGSTKQYTRSATALYHIWSAFIGNSRTIFRAAWKPRSFSNVFFSVRSKAFTAVLCLLANTLLLVVIELLKYIRASLAPLESKLVHPLQRRKAHACFDAYVTPDSFAYSRGYFISVHSTCLVLFPPHQGRLFSDGHMLSGVKTHCYNQPPPPSIAVAIESCKLVIPQLFGSRFSQGRLDPNFEDRNEHLIENLGARYPSAGSFEMETFTLLHIARLCQNSTIHASAASIVVSETRVTARNVGLGENYLPVHTWQTITARLIQFIIRVIVFVLLQVFTTLHFYRKGRVAPSCHLHLLASYRNDCGCSSCPLPRCLLICQPMLRKELPLVGGCR